MSEPNDPVDEMVRVIEETLGANALRLTTHRGGYVGGGQPHATLDSDGGAVEAIARGLLARRVAEPSRPAATPDPRVERLEAALDAIAREWDGALPLMNGVDTALRDAIDAGRALLRSPQERRQSEGQ